MTARTLLDFENAICSRRIESPYRTVLWTVLTAIYEDELIEEPQGRGNIETEGAASC